MQLEKKPKTKNLCKICKCLLPTSKNLTCSSLRCQERCFTYVLVHQKNDYQECTTRMHLVPASVILVFQKFTSQVSPISNRSKFAFFKWRTFEISNERKPNLHEQFLYLFAEQISTFFCYANTMYSERK